MVAGVRSSRYKESNRARKNLRGNHKANSRSRRNETQKGEYHRKRRSEKGDSYKNKDDAISRQCHGPGCVYEARPGSKYCSDKCGMNLARRRIYAVLPERVQQWKSSPSLSDQKDRQTLEAILRDQLAAKSKLTDLDRKEEELLKLIAKAKQTPIKDHQEDTNEDAEIHMNCVTCGDEIGLRNALSHMERCFKKFEGRISFGSVYKTHMETANIICDYYNPKNRTYCKRLSVICPQHYRDPDVSDNEVCGYPMQTNVFDVSGDFCSIPKQKCEKHRNWENFRKAQIGLERIRILFQLDGLAGRERSVRTSVANRGGVLGLMLHQTVDQ